MPTVPTRDLDLMRSRVTSLSKLLNLIVPIPDDWVEEGATTPSSEDDGQLPCKKCEKYDTLIGAWRKALKWTDGLDSSLSVMLASIVSVKSVGDQLWIKIIGPAACGKSTLCEAVSVNRKYVLAKSTIRGFHSGWREGGGGEEGEDSSLVAQLYNKTLVTKDGDTLLQSPNLGQILAEARDLYDSTSRTHYRNAMSKDYSGVRMTWLLCGTSSLRSIDESELGERFLDCVIMDGIDDELEEEVLWRVVNRAERNMSVEADGSPEKNYEPELAEAMMLTGGYVGWLRENSVDVLSKIKASEAVLRRCTRLGKFVAFMRARPSTRQDETAEREFAARLVSQHIRLAKCLAAVMNRSTVDEEVMRRVLKVCLDTSRGQTLDIVHVLYEGGDEEGTEPRALSLYTSQTESQTRGLLRFLKRIEVVETFKGKSRSKGMANRARWRLTSKVKELYGQVYEV